LSSPEATWDNRSPRNRSLSPGDGEFTSRPLGQLRELRNVGVIVLAIRKQAGDTIFKPSDESESLPAMSRSDG
jgi:K+/H+ antiporter YhaU regulatory subunit KhtT